MIIFRSLEEWNVNEPLVATLGTFDGMHLGHQFILQDLKKIAKSQNAKTLLISLNPHPRIVLKQAHNLRFIQTLEEKIKSIENQGMDYLFLLPFNEEIANWSAETFLRDIIFGKLNVDTFLIGYDHRFGKNRESNFELVQSIANQLHKKVVKLTEFSKDGKKISSTIIRNLILEGKILQANELLGYPFQISGTVIEGDKRGRILGFPTANIQLNDSYKIIPPNGVYVCKVIRNHEVHYGVTNIGIRPTFQETKHQIEVHILDFQSDIYGECLTIEFLNFIREEKKFENLEQLKKQILLDIEETRNYFKVNTL